MKQAIVLIVSILSIVNKEPAQPYHPETRSFLEKLCQLGVMEPPYKSGTPMEVRAKYKQYEKLSQALDPVPYDGIRLELFVPVDGSTETIPVYVYQPREIPQDAAILVYFHGGGMVLGSREAVEELCTRLSTYASCLVVNVEYRLAPEHKFPTFMDDGCTVARWVLDNKTTVGGSEDSKVGVAGDSAGGTIAASISHDVPGLAFQILVYAKLFAFDEQNLKSHEEYKNDVMLPEGLVNWLRDLAFEPSDYTNPRAASINRPRFDNLPPTLFIVAECDPLRDESYEYAKKLNEVNVPYELHLIKGAMHNFFAMPGPFPELTTKAYRIAGEFIKKWAS